MSLKKGIKRILGYFGYEIHLSQRRPRRLGHDPFWDIRKLTLANETPIIFDVGANIGQSVQNFRSYFNYPIIHSFEPGPETFRELERCCASLPSVYLNNIALGSQPGSMYLFEHKVGSEMNSLLEPGTECWGGGEIKGKARVNVSTIDEYCKNHNIYRIDILKIDTQGFDLEVIKGSENLLRRKAIHLIYMEIIFSETYKGLPRLDEIYGFLADRGYVLVTFYPFYYWEMKASWTEALFIHPEYVANPPR